MRKLTVLIPTFNEEANLPDCLASLRGLGDEVLVVDSFSTDRTVQIAREAGARVIQHEYINSAAQKNWAIPQASSEWVLIVDADERMTPGLAAEIRGVLSSPDPPPFAGYFIRRRTMFLGREIRHGGWESNDVLRLFLRDYGRYEEREVHADVRVGGRPVGRLKEPLLHITCVDLNRYFQKFNRYTTQAAERWWREGRRAGWWNFVFHPMWHFFRMYIIRLGFLDGMPGFLLASFSAFTRFVRYAKLWALVRSGRPRPVEYDVGTTNARQIDGEASAAGGSADRTAAGTGTEACPLPVSEAEGKASCPGAPGKASPGTGA
ncbi:MAG: glycosyltransferase family 2 protein [Planctomycetota bacterium]|nr:glycosyltransferase family 2 protein [Planctomycetota bacterium]